MDDWLHWDSAESREWDVAMRDRLEDEPPYYALGADK